MATQQTRTQRQVAAKKGAATRRKTAAKRSASSTKASANQTRRSAAATARAGQTTTRRAARTAGRGLESAATRLDAVGRQAQRALLIQLGAAASVRDTVVDTARTYSNVASVTRELRRYERRGERVVRQSRQALARRRREASHEVNGWRDEAAGVVDRVTRLG